VRENAVSTSSEDHGAYARRISEGLRQYAQDLLEENGRLRALATLCQAERERLASESEVLRRENGDLRHQIRQARMEALSATEDLLEARRDLSSRELALAQIDERIRSADVETHRLADRFAVVEEQNHNLANLYVASYRLHGTLDRQEVIDALHEILANLVGSEETALFERPEDQAHLTLVASTGIDPAPLQEVPLGHGLIGHTAQTGELFVTGQPEPGSRTQEEQHLTACIPLSLDGRVAGVIAIFRLLPQKSELAELDHELFDLLGSHAATALYCTALHAQKAQGAPPWASERPESREGMRSDVVGILTGEAAS